MRNSLPLLLCLVTGTLSAADVESRLELARVHEQGGRYAEALEVYDELSSEKASGAAVAAGRSRCLEAEGRWKEATAVLEAAVKTVEKTPGNSGLWARLAEVQFLQGRYTATLKSVETALDLEPDQPLARLVQADLHAATGKLEEATEGYRWFVRYYNRAQPKDAATLIVIARGAAQYARWKANTRIFSFLVNTLCPDALKDDERYWQSFHLSGDLFLEKYNRPDGLPDLRKALAVNPRAAEVYVSLGNSALGQHDLDEAAQFSLRALKINPRLVSALRLKADLALNDGKVSDSLKVLQEALEVNPHDELTLGCVAACYLLIDGPPPDAEMRELLDNLETIERVKIEKPGRFSKLVMELAKRNRRPGSFFSMLGTQLESRRKYDLAELCYAQAIDSHPMLAEPQTALGMLYMRIGRVDEAKAILDKAFDLDPYHVRVSNMRKVIKVLSGYETISTDHFVIRVDSKLDMVLGKYMAEYLESQYDPLVKQFGFEPPVRTQFEIYNKAKGLSGHQWFSARLIGLPWIQTVGASTGVIVVLASPTSGQQFNWARVLKHEFSHIITLQQTKFNIPHWFTEALAVRVEGYARPNVWNELLRERVPKGEIMNLDTINLGFIRPKTPLDWQMAYCQSSLYAQYMVEKQGEKSLAEMLAAYRDNLSTDQAIKKVFSIDKATFEKGYREFLDKLVAELRGPAAEPVMTLAELEKAYRANPDDPKAAGRFAGALLGARQRKKARELAEAALKADPTQPHAALVMARLTLRAEDREGAVAILEPAVDKKQPHPQLLRLLARLKLSQGETDAATELYLLGRQHDPLAPIWVRNLAVCYSRAEETEKLKGVLLELIRMEADLGAPRKKLAELALDEKDFAGGLKYATMALHTDVLDVETHRILAESHSGLKQHGRAIEEYEVALELKPKETDLMYGLAGAQIAAGNKAAARKTLEALLEENPDHEDAKKLLEKL